MRLILVSVGTAKKVKAVIEEELQQRGVEIPFDVASNPEFLKEGAAIKDFMSPDRVVIGVDSERAKNVMSQLYRPLMLNNFRVIFTDIPSAEMIKYAANSMLATRISFMNDIANLCELVGADVNMVRVASMELAAYFIISALGISVKITRKLFSIKGRYNWLITFFALSESTPITTRSGLMKSFMAAPSFRNSGLLATSKGISTPRCCSSSSITAFTFLAVPTETKIKRIRTSTH
jgi:hypothetical protein